RWAPRGGTLAFLASSGGRTRLWLYAALGAARAPRMLSAYDSLGGEILAFAWSPTGESVAYLAREPAALPTERHAISHTPGLVLFHDTPGDFTGPTSPAYRRDSLGAYVAEVGLKSAEARVVARR